VFGGAFPDQTFVPLCFTSLASWTGSPVLHCGHMVLAVGSADLERDLSAITSAVVQPDVSVRCVICSEVFAFCGVALAVGSADLERDLSAITYAIV